MAEPRDDILSTWYGRPVDEMSHAELLDAFKKLARMHQDHLESAARGFRPSVQEADGR